MAEKMANLKMVNANGDFADFNRQTVEQCTSTCRSSLMSLKFSWFLLISFKMLSKDVTTIYTVYAVVMARTTLRVYLVLLMNADQR